MKTTQDTIAGFTFIVLKINCFNASSEEFSLVMREIAEMGAAVLGGCCGTSPEYIASLENQLEKTEIKGK